MLTQMYYGAVSISQYCRKARKIRPEAIFNEIDGITNGNHNPVDCIIKNL